MRPGTVINKDDEHEQASAVSIEQEIEYAMANMVGSAEGLEPTYQEAQRRPDWPKWQEAI